MHAMIRIQYWNMTGKFKIVKGLYIIYGHMSMGYCIRKVDAEKGNGAIHNKRSYINGCYVLGKQKLKKVKGST